MRSRVTQRERQLDYRVVGPLSSSLRSVPSSRQTTTGRESWQPDHSGGSRISFSCATRGQMGHGSGSSCQQGRRSLAQPTDSARGSRRSMEVMIQYLGDTGFSSSDRPLAAVTPANDVGRTEVLDRAAAQAGGAAAIDLSSLACVKSELEGRAGKFGDVFFEDLASLVHRTVSRTHSCGPIPTEATSKLKRIGEFVSERQRLLSQGIKDALTRVDSFPKLSAASLQTLASNTTTDGYFAGQNIITQGEYDDSSFRVLRRGQADIIVDGVVVDSVGKGAGIGEMSLLFGTRRSATVRCVTACEVIVLSRAAYQTEVSKLPETERTGGLECILLKFWDLVTSDEGVCNNTGVKQTTVPASVYRRLHIRTSKTLTMGADELDYDERERDEMAESDWKEDTQRYGLPADGRLTRTMFFDSMCQLVDLWAGGLDVSFVQFLTTLYDNIAEWSTTHSCPKFRPLVDVGCLGEEMERKRLEAQARNDADELKRRNQSLAEEQRRGEVRTPAALLLVPTHSVRLCATSVVTLADEAVSAAAGGAEAFG
jgi:hypothetical protein